MSWDRLGRKLGKKEDIVFEGKAQPRRTALRSKEAEEVAPKTSPWTPTMPGTLKLIYHNKTFFY